MPSTTTPSSTPNLTLWIWPTGLYPRRLVYYLKAKRLPRSVLSDLAINPCYIDMSVPGLIVREGYEARPEGTSLPCLRINSNSLNPKYIYQSSTMLDYLEDLYPTNSLSGHDAFHRAHVKDITQLINESLPWTSVYLRHTHPMTLSWSGMTKEEQILSAGEDGLKQWKICMARLERWVEDDVMGKRAKSIAGGNEPTLADFTLMAARTYLFEVYGGWDVFEGCEVLQTWYRRAVECEWCLDREGLERVERFGFEELFA